MLAFRRRFAEGVDIKNTSAANLQHNIILSTFRKTQTDIKKIHRWTAESWFYFAAPLPGSTKLYFSGRGEPHRVLSSQDVTRGLTKFEWLVSDDEK